MLRSPAGMLRPVGAGVIFAMMEVVGATAMGDPPLMPFRMFASVVMGRSALEPTTAMETALVVGSVAHLALSAGFGLIFGLINARFSAETQTRSGRQALFGLIVGAGLWLVNFQILARLLYPWFLDAPQVLQMLMHAMFFGLPLGLRYARAERHVHHVYRSPAHA